MENNKICVPIVYKGGPQMNKRLNERQIIRLTEENLENYVYDLEGEKLSKQDLTSQTVKG